MDIARNIVYVLEEKKGENIILLDIHDVAVFADYFVICSGTTDRMIQSLMKAVIDHTRNNYKKRPVLEGLPRDGWLLADYGDLILHVFSPAQRQYYDLEQLWSEGKVLLQIQ